jgi:serine/threonine protein kinase
VNRKAQSKISTRLPPVLERVCSQRYDSIKGAYGEVRKCYVRDSGALRAVKIIKKALLEDDEKEKLINEVQILKQMVSSPSYSIF